MSLKQIDVKRIILLCILIKPIVKKSCTFVSLKLSDIWNKVFRNLSHFNDWFKANPVRIIFKFRKIVFLHKAKNMHQSIYLFESPR